jgi:hypothetical protein
MRSSTGFDGVVPDADFSDIESGVIERPTYSIEINIRRADSVDGFALRVRGDSAADGMIPEILQALGYGRWTPTP